ncbi:MAG: hypothetical protein GEU86_02145 [Actinophytocola sp.]|nr:hypothetical protein [Actinophytocola sp.]
MTTTTKNQTTWGEWLRSSASAAGKVLRRWLRDVAYGIDAWSSITHGIEPSKREPGVPEQSRGRPTTSGCR